MASPMSRWSKKVWIEAMPDATRPSSSPLTCCTGKREGEESNDNAMGLSSLRAQRVGIPMRSATPLREEGKGKKKKSASAAMVPYLDYYNARFRHGRLGERRDRAPRRRSGGEEKERREKKKGGGRRKRDRWMSTHFYLLRGGRHTTASVGRSRVPSRRGKKEMARTCARSMSLRRRRAAEGVATRKASRSRRGGKRKGVSCS